MKKLFIICLLLVTINCYGVVSIPFGANFGGNSYVDSQGFTWSIGTQIYNAGVNSYGWSGGDAWPHAIDVYNSGGAIANTTEDTLYAIGNFWFSAGSVVNYLQWDCELPNGNYRVYLGMTWYDNRTYQIDMGDVSNTQTVQTTFNTTTEAYNAYGVSPTGATAVEGWLTDNPKYFSVTITTGKFRIVYKSNPSILLMNSIYIKSEPTFVPPHMIYTY